MRTRCSRIGTKSLDLEHEIRADGRLAAQAKSVLVGYDYELGASVRCRTRSARVSVSETSGLRDSN